MKRLTDYISEKLVINQNYSIYTCAPKSFKELRKIIEDRYDELGPGTEPNPIDFNDINVTEMTTFYDDSSSKGIFEETEFEYIDISDWNVSNVKDMSYMFVYCKELKSVGNLSKWDVSNVKDMHYMFCDNQNLKSVGDLSKWNVSNVKDMHYMFDSCVKLESVGNLSNWDVSNVKDMRYMFCECQNLKSIGDLSKWNVSNVKGMRWMFMNSGIINIPDWYKE